MTIQVGQQIAVPGFIKCLDNFLGSGAGQGINAYGQELENCEGRKPTFRASIGAFTPQATPQDFLTLTGNPLCVVRLLAVEVYLAATAAAAFEVFLNYNSAPDTGGTSTNPVAVPSDPSDPGWTTALATVNAYTVAPTAGTKVGSIRSGRVVGGTIAGGGSGICPLVWVFGQYGDKCPILRTASQQIALNGNGAALPAGSVFEINILWLEETLTGN